jgi:hypothetical protein
VVLRDGVADVIDWGYDRSEDDDVDGGSEASVQDEQLTTTETCKSMLEKRGQQLERNRKASPICSIDLRASLPLAVVVLLANPLVFVVGIFIASLP